MGKLTIGDTPEQLGCCLTADAIMVDGKIVTREDVRRLQSGHNELAATVEALRSACLDYENMETPNSWGLIFDEIKRCANSDPQQHLRDVQAEAGRAGYLQGVHDWQLAESKYEDFDTQSRSAQYAERVKDGEK